jgi:nicotinamidase-related amidase
MIMYFTSAGARRGGLTLEGSTLDTLSPGPHVALLSVDLMQRIVDGPCVPHTGSAVVQRSSRLAEAVRASGGHVAWVWSERPGPVQPEGSQLVDGIDRRPEDAELVKHTWGAFTNTSLAQTLRGWRATTVWLTGISTSHGVESTGRFADELGFDVVFVEDAMTATEAGDHAHSVQRIFPKLGPVVRHSDLLTD